MLFAVIGDTPYNIVLHDLQARLLIVGPFHRDG
jgi:hypothetical protein